VLGLVWYLLHLVHCEIVCGYKMKAPLYSTTVEEPQNKSQQPQKSSIEQTTDKNSSEREKSTISHRTTDDENAKLGNDRNSGDNVHTKQQLSVGSEDREVLIKRAVLFLNHPSVANVSEPEKTMYLQSRGLSISEISAAKELTSPTKNSGHDFDQVWYSNKNKSLTTKSHEKRDEDRRELAEKGKHYQQSFTQSNPHQNQYNLHDPNRQSYYADDDNHVGQLNDPELPSALVPLSIGGLLAIYAMAAIRWLNGGDFVLFPPPESQNLDSEQTSAIECGEMTSASLTNIDESPDENESLERTNEEEYDYKAIDNEMRNDGEGGYNETEDSAGQVHFDDAENFTRESLLSQDLQALTVAIEKYSDIQERNLKSKLDEKARSKTNNVMDLLAKKQPANTEKSDSDFKHNGVVSAFEMQALIQLVEVKCDLKTIHNELLSDPSDKKGKDILMKLESISAQLMAVESSLTRRSNVKTSASSKLEVASISGTKDGNEASDSFTSTSKLPSLQNSVDTIKNDDLDVNHSVKPDAANSEETVEVGEEAIAKSIQKMKENNDVKLVKSSCQMLFLYISNLAKKPTSDQYQKIYTKNNTFKNNIEKVQFSKDVLISAGFVDHGSYLEWQTAHDETLEGDCNNHSSVNVLNKAVKLLRRLQSDLNESQ
jgi:hypothetical protein